MLTNITNTGKRKAPSDDEDDIPPKKHKDDIPHAESSKDAEKRKADEDLNKEQQQKKSSKYLSFIIYLPLFF